MKNSTIISEKISSIKEKLSHDIQDLLQQKEDLNSEITRLNDEKNVMNTDILKAENLLTEKRELFQMLIQSSEKRKKKLEMYSSTDRAILNEIEFFSDEKSRLTEELAIQSTILKKQVESLDDTFKDIVFFKGEIKILLDKMSMLEADIPEKLDGVNMLDSLFTMTLDGLKSLYQKAHHSEKKMKAQYYQKKLIKGRRYA
ncbi:MAG: hypothetical protein HQK75_16120 [Candidatus Magnetomorum sp.]|nr:hypothetical protein [Candidatus Magnetomorum sp.]